MEVHGSSHAVVGFTDSGPVITSLAAVGLLASADSTTHPSIPTTTTIFVHRDLLFLLGSTFLFFLFHRQDVFEAQESNSFKFKLSGYSYSDDKRYTGSSDEQGWMVLTRSLQAAGAQTFVECEKNLKNSAREKFLIPPKKNSLPLQKHI